MIIIMIQSWKAWVLQAEDVLDGKLVFYAQKVLEHDKYDGKVFCHSPHAQQVWCEHSQNFGELTKLCFCGFLLVSSVFHFDYDLHNHKNTNKKIQFSPQNKKHHCSTRCPIQKIYLCIWLNQRHIQSRTSILWLK